MATFAATRATRWRGRGPSSLTSSGALLPLAGVALAVLEGCLAGIDPKLGVGFALGVGFVVLVFVDLSIGFSTIAAVAFLETFAANSSVSVGKLVGLILVAAWLALATTSRVSARSFSAQRPGLAYVLLLFLGWSAVSLAWADVQADAVTSVFRYALNAMLIPIAYVAIRDDRHVIRVLVALLIGATIAGISGIVSVPTGEADVIRATGTVGDANELAAALILSLGVAGAFAANRHLAAAPRVLGAVAATISIAGVLVSLSRGGLIGICAAAAAAIVLGARWRGRIAVAVGGIALTGLTYFTAFASLPAKERVLNIGGGGGGRLDLWTVAGRMVAAHPVRGVGTGQFKTSSVHYLLQPGAILRGDFILSQPKVAHNTYLNVLAELGVVGGALFAALIVVSFASLLHATVIFRRAGDERMEILARGTAIGVVGYLVALLFISENYSKLFWVVLGLGPVMRAVAGDRVRRTEPVTLGEH